MGLLRSLARARLAARVIRRLRRAGTGDARYDARAFQVRFTAPGDDVPTIIELGPLLATPGRRKVDEFIAGLLLAPGLPQSWAEVKPLLRPVLRGATPGNPLRRAVLPYLSEYVVVDQPETMTYVAAAQLSMWKVGADAVFAAALANLSGAVLHGRAAEPVVVQFVDDGDAYWTSHLLLAHWLERLAGQVGGVPVAFAPERGTLLVTADGSDHLAGLFARAEEIYTASSRAITPMAYVSDENGCTVPYAAGPAHPLHRAVRRAERVLAVQEYGRQAPDLRSALADEERPTDRKRPTDEKPPTDGKRPTDEGPPTVAELRLIEDATAGWVSRAVWERDSAVLLPEADEVLVGERVWAWAELRPHLTAVDGLEPPRWRAEAWPTV